MNEPRNKYKFGKADGVGSLESNIIVGDNDESTITFISESPNFIFGFSNLLSERM